MKKLFILLTLAVTSCVTGTQEQDIRVYYIDGGIEDVTLSTKEGGYDKQFGDREAVVYFHNSCLYTNHNQSKYEPEYTGCIRCGVKDYDVLEIRTIK